MNLFEAIYNHPRLCLITRQTCQENKAIIQIAEQLLQDKALDSSKILILKPDAYYNSANMRKPPPSIDCIIFVKCKSGYYDIYMIELRDTNDKNKISLSVILPKFKTIIERFIPEFSEVFNQFQDYVHDVHLWLVTDKYKTSQLDYAMCKKKIMGTILEQYTLMTPLKVFNKLAIIEPQLPYMGRPAPVILPCA